MSKGDIEDFDPADLGVLPQHTPPERGPSKDKPHHRFSYRVRIPADWFTREHPEFYKVSEIAKEFGVSYAVVLRWTQNGLKTIPGRKFPNGRASKLIPAAEALRLAREGPPVNKGLKALAQRQLAVKRGEIIDTRPMNARDQRIMQFHLMGWSCNQISREIGISPTTVRYTLYHLPAAQEYKAKVLGEVQQHVRDLASTAVDKVGQAMQSDDPDVYLRGVQRWESLFSRLTEEGIRANSLVTHLREDPNDDRDDVLQRLSEQLERFKDLLPKAPKEIEGEYVEVRAEKDA